MSIMTPTDARLIEKGHAILAADAGAIEQPITVSGDYETDQGRHLYVAVRDGQQRRHLVAYSPEWLAAYRDAAEAQGGVHDEAGEGRALRSALAALGIGWDD